MDYFPAITDTELSWIIDAIVSGKSAEGFLGSFSPSDLDKILILANEKIKSIEESKIVFPEAREMSPELMRFETLMGLPPMKYFLRILPHKDEYFR